MSVPCRASSPGDDAVVATAGSAASVDPCRQPQDGASSELSGQHSSAAATASGAVTPRSLQQLVAWLSAVTSGSDASA